MKQHITEEQQKEIPFELRTKFRKLCVNHGYVLGGNVRLIQFLTIGKMIEILGERLVKIEYNIDREEYEVFIVVGNDFFTNGFASEFSNKELTNALFEAIKEVL